jgi:hypothetical protein
MMRILPLIFGLFLLLTPAFRTVAEETKLPRISIMHLAGAGPNLDRVLPLLNEQLAEIDLEMETVGLEVAEFPESDKNWTELARRTASDAQTIAAMAYDCQGQGQGQDTCTITLIVHRSQSIVKLSYPRPHDSKASAFATAATLREMIAGPLISELKRLAGEARAPKPATKVQTGLLKSPFESTRHENNRNIPPWLWLEASYQGDCAYPEGRPLNGVSIGVDFEPTPMLGLLIQAGWLGMERGEAEGAEVLLHRLNTMLTVRMIFSIGPARISIGALGRLDTVFLSAQNAPGFGSSNDTYLEASVGGITMWHLPLPKGLNFVIGAGLTASVVSREVEAVGFSGSQETIIPASTLRMIWTVGLELSPSGSPSGK